MNITVNIGILVEEYRLDPAKFLPGHTYSLATLMKEIGLLHAGRPKFKERKKKK